MTIVLYLSGKSRFEALKKHFLDSGLESRVHKNTKRLPSNAFTYFDRNNVKKFVMSYATDHAILLPGRIPGYKRDDLQLLPTCTTKKVCADTNVIVSNFLTSLSVCMAAIQSCMRGHRHQSRWL